MSEKHGLHNYDRHVGIFEKYLEDYSTFYDESAPLQEHHQAAASALMPNTVHKAVDPKSGTQLPTKFFGVYIIRFGPDAIKFSWYKKLAVERQGTANKSRTVAYSYNLSWVDSYKGNKVTRLVRFDNQDQEHWEHGTPHHFHCELTCANKQIEKRPTPTHTGADYPHVSDLLKGAIWLLENDNTRSHKKALAVFESIPVKCRPDLECWLPPMEKVFPWLSCLRRVQPSVTSEIPGHYTPTPSPAV